MTLVEKGPVKRLKKGKTSAPSTKMINENANLPGEYCLVWAKGLIRVSVAVSQNFPTQYKG